VNEHIRETGPGSFLHEVQAEYRRQRRRAREDMAGLILAGILLWALAMAIMGVVP
jgi:hypothetical protein